jgi:hypothetical protein
MSRRADPERIFTARRMAVRNGLIGHDMPLETAVAWCDALAGRGRPGGMLMTAQVLVRRRLRAQASVWSARNSVREVPFTAFIVCATARRTVPRPRDARVAPSELGST